MSEDLIWINTTSDLLSIIFFIPPVPKARPRFTRNGHVYTDQKTVQFERALKLLMLPHVKHIFLGPIRVNLELHLKRPKRTKNLYPCVRPDLDNYIKAVFDAMNGVLWKDDGQIFSLRAVKFYTETTPRIQLQVEKMG